MHIETLIRPYKKEDRDAIRSLCCDTAFMGLPVDLVFSDREAYADMQTLYYLDDEPNSCLVAEQDGKFIGYLLGCAKPNTRTKLNRHTIPMAARAIWRLFSGAYGIKNFRLFRWFLTGGYNELPATPPDSGHLHISLTPEHRANGIGKKLVETFEEQLLQSGVRRCQVDVLSTDTRGAYPFFKKLGYQDYDRREFTALKLEEKINYHSLLKEV